MRSRPAPRWSPDSSALGLGLRLAYAAEGRDHLPPDARVYAQIAENLYRDGDFDARGPGTPRIYQPTSAYSPGLPLFVAGVYALTGGVHLRAGADRAGAVRRRLASCSPTSSAGGSPARRRG